MAKPAVNKKSVRTTISLPPDDYSQIETIAEQKRVSVAWVIRDAVERYLRKNPQVRATRPS